PLALSAASRARHEPVVRHSPMRRCRSAPRQIQRHTPRAPITEVSSSYAGSSMFHPIVNANVRGAVALGRVAVARLRLALGVVHSGAFRAGAKLASAALVLEVNIGIRASLLWVRFRELVPHQAALVAAVLSTFHADSEVADLQPALGF